MFTFQMSSVTRQSRIAYRNSDGRTDAAGMEKYFSFLNDHMTKINKILGHKV